MQGGPNEGMLLASCSIPTFTCILLSNGPSEGILPAGRYFCRPAAFRATY